MADRRRVVIAGAGFAGIKVAKGLEASCDVTLVAPTDRFVYLPLIHEVLSETVTPGTVTKRLAEILPKTRLVHGRAARVDGGALLTAAGERFDFDVLVVAVGAESNDFGVPGVQDHALPFYSVGDALRANAMLKVRATEVEGRPLRVAVVGAGFTGVEVAGEAAALLDKLDVPREVTLLEAMPGIFPRQTESFRSEVRDGLERLRLTLRTSQKIVEVKEDGLYVAVGDGRSHIPVDVMFWCAGAKPRRIEGVDPNVRPTLQSVGRDDVFLVGDAADFPREMAVPKLAQTAEDQASVVVANVLAPGRLREYKPFVKGLIVSIGPGYAVAELAGGQVLSGKIPWHVKRTLYKAKIALA